MSDLADYVSRKVYENNERDIPEHFEEENNQEQNENLDEMIENLEKEREYRQEMLNKEYSKQNFIRKNEDLEKEIQENVDREINEKKNVVNLNDINEDTENIIYSDTESNGILSLITKNINTTVFVIILVLLVMNNYFDPYIIENIPYMNNPVAIFLVKLLLIAVIFHLGQNFI